MTLRHLSSALTIRLSLFVSLTMTQPRESAFVCHSREIVNRAHTNAPVVIRPGSRRVVTANPLPRQEPLQPVNLTADFNQQAMDDPADHAEQEPASPVQIQLQPVQPLHRQIRRPMPALWPRALENDA
jgi:hypothetical protein